MEWPSQRASSVAPSSSTSLPATPHSPHSPHPLVRTPSFEAKDGVNGSLNGVFEKTHSKTTFRDSEKSRTTAIRKSSPSIFDKPVKARSKSLDFEETPFCAPFFPLLLSPFEKRQHPTLCFFSIIFVFSTLFQASLCLSRVRDKAPLPRNNRTISVFLETTRSPQKEQDHHITRRKIATNEELIKSHQNRHQKLLSRGTAHLPGAITRRNTTIASNKFVLTAAERELLEDFEQADEGVAMTMLLHGAWERLYSRSREHPDFKRKDNAWDRATFLKPRMFGRLYTLRNTTMEYPFPWPIEKQSVSITNKYLKNFRPLRNVGRFNVSRFGLIFSLRKTHGFWRQFLVHSKCGAGYISGNNSSVSSSPAEEDDENQGKQKDPVATKGGQMCNGWRIPTHWQVSGRDICAAPGAPLLANCRDCMGRCCGVTRGEQHVGKILDYEKWRTLKNRVVAATGSPRRVRISSTSGKNEKHISGENSSSENESTNKDSGCAGSGWNEFRSHGLSFEALVGVLDDASVSDGTKAVWDEHVPDDRTAPLDATVCNFFKAVTAKMGARNRTVWPVFRFSNALPQVDGDAHHDDPHKQPHPAWGKRGGPNLGLKRGEPTLTLARRLQCSY